MVTFTVTPNLKATNIETLGHNVKLSTTIQDHDIVSNNPTVLLDSNVQNPLKWTPFSNGFIGAAFKAYSNHHHLSFTPDDVWIAIATAFSRYVNKHAEEMREIFVSHQGKKELVVTDVGSIKSVNWDILIAKLSGLIEENTKTDVKEWMEPNFSTTTTLTRTVGSLCLMSSMQHYFSYKCCLCCGLPSVTLHGTLQDWEALRTKAERLKQFNQPELSDWCAVLLPVLDQFIRSYSGEVDTDFWNRICTRTGGGSGPSFLEGWILSFIPFSEHGDYILSSYESIQETNSYGKVDMDYIPTSAVDVPVTIDDNGMVYETIFYAGHLVATQGPTPDSVQPNLSWIILEKNKDPKKNQFLF